MVLRVRMQRRKTREYAYIKNEELCFEHMLPPPSMRTLHIARHCAFAPTKKNVLAWVLVVVVYMLIIIEQASNFGFKLRNPHNKTQNSRPAPFKKVAKFDADRFGGFCHNCNLHSNPTQGSVKFDS